MLRLWIFRFAFFSLLLFAACKPDTTQKVKQKSPSQTLLEVPVAEEAPDSLKLNWFVKRYPKLAVYEPQMRELYRNHHWKFVWFDAKGITELGQLIRSKINTIETEGVHTKIPYKSYLEDIFQSAKPMSNSANDYLISAFYFFYADKVFHGFDVKTSRELGWYLPRKKVSYVHYLDSLMANPKLIEKNERNLLGQYYKLKDVLGRYRKAAQKNEVDTVKIPIDMDPLKVGDTSDLVAHVRKRLYLMGYLNKNTESAVFDASLARPVRQYKASIGLTPSELISGKMIRSVNIPLKSRIKTLMVNMERCRWIPTEMSQAKQYISVNIPSYELVYYKNGKPALESNVVVGKVMNQTVIFSGMMKYIVFSPYWNVPPSIIKKEIKPALEKDKDYLAKHNMEWDKGRIRQKPGPQNSLGWVKFLFPNSNNIYLHDSPAKSLFNRNSRAFSHGCIRVAKPLELAQTLLEDDPNWTPDKVEKTMYAGTESWCTLKEAVPVYIGYFTCWVDDAGILHFYDDVYKRDGRLSELIFKS
jgi:murein L,D-transpeptidase YcbB/YkuD